MALTDTNLSDGIYKNPRRVIPDKPVRPDRVVIKTEKVMMERVVVRMGDKIETYHIGCSSYTTSQTGMLTFYQAFYYGNKTIGQKSYWYDKTPGTRSGIVFFPGAVIMMDSVWRDVGDKEDVMDAVDQDRQAYLAHRYSTGRF